MASRDPNAISRTIAAAEQSVAFGAVAALGILDRTAPELDLDAVAAGLVGEPDQLFARLLGDVPGLLGELKAGRRDLAAGRDAGWLGLTDAAEL